MKPKMTLKAILNKVATPPLRILVDAIGGARVPDGQWFNIPKGFHPFDYMHLINGTYEQPEIEILEQFFKPDHTIIEIGANIGVVTCAALKKKLADHGTLICIEANPVSIPCLEQNIQQARNGHQVKILPVAVGAPEVEGEIHMLNQKKSLGSGLVETSRVRKHDKEVGVPVYSLSSIVNEYAGNGYSLICDAEGAEILILDKDPRSLDTCRQIAIELHHPRQTNINVTPEEMVSQIEGLGFTNRGQRSNTYYFDRAPT